MPELMDFLEFVAWVCGISLCGILFLILVFGDSLVADDPWDDDFDQEHKT